MHAKISENLIDEDDLSPGEQIASIVDKHVGARMKVRRCFLGLSQEYVADFLNITFQQVQKYEKGFNRISAGRLWRLANLFGVPVSYFYEDVDMAIGSQIHPEDWCAMTTPCFHDSCDDVDLKPAPRLNKASMELIRAFSKIKDPAISKNILDLVKACAATYGSDEDDDLITSDFATQEFGLLD